MRGIFTTNFWLGAAERAVKTAFQTLGIYVGGGELFSAWELEAIPALGVFLGGALLSVITSVGSAPLGYAKDDPSAL